MKNKVIQEHCIGWGAYGSFRLVFHSFLFSLVTQNFYFLYCKHKTVAVVGKWIELKGHKKKKANANVDRERESPTKALRAKCFAIMWGIWWCGESTKLLTFNFSIVVVQVSPRCVGMKIRIFFLFICWCNC